MRTDRQRVKPAYDAVEAAYDNAVTAASRKRNKVMREYKDALLEAKNKVKLQFEQRIQAADTEYNEVTVLAYRTYLKPYINETTGEWIGATVQAIRENGI